MIWLNSRRLRSSSPQTRRKAIESLTAARSLRGLRLLIASLGDQDPEVRWAAAKALGTINEELSVAARAAALAEDVTATVVNEVRAAQCVRPRRQHARHTNPATCLAAIAAMKSEPSESETAMLLDSLGHPEARVRLAAAQALEQEPNPVHLTHFLTLLADEHFEVRLTAIQFLRRLADPAVAKALIPRLSDPDNDVRVAAAQALGTIRNPAALEPLVLSLTDEEAAVRHAAAAALDEIDPRWVRTDAAQRALPRLEALRKDPRPWIAAAAQKVAEALEAAKGKNTEVWKRESGIRKL
jgi:HEAT repeat protein